MEQNLTIKTFEKNIFKVLEFHFPPILTLDNTILDNTILSKNKKIAAPYLAPSLINIHICMVSKIYCIFPRHRVAECRLSVVDCRLSIVGCRMSGLDCRLSLSLIIVHF